MLLRAIECLLLFVVTPIALATTRRRVNPIPLLLIFGSALTLVLYRDPTFDIARLTRIPEPKRYLLYIVSLLPAAAAVMYLLLSIVAPKDRFKFLRKKPRVWAVLMVLYPLISVVPQTVIYRAYFMHRYEPLFGDGWSMIFVAAIAFGLGHVIFRHPLPVLLTAVGGVLFAWRYQATGSAPLSAIEHALYGNLAFTIGFSRYLYHASTRTAEAAAAVIPADGARKLT